MDDDDVDDVSFVDSIISMGEEMRRLSDDWLEEITI